MTKALVAAGSTELEKAEWMPSVVASAGGAHRLTKALVAVAHWTLREERDEGSDVPEEIAADGELNPAYEIILRERALSYLETLQLEAEASTVEILAEICQRGLWLHHPSGWSSLAEFLRGMGEGHSDSYRSIVGRFVSVVLPYLEQKEIMSIREVMELITGGGFSRIYGILAYLQAAVEDGDRTTVENMMMDAGTHSKRELRKKYARARHVRPARAKLEKVGPVWVLTIRMNDRQRRLIMNRLGDRIDTDVKRFLEETHDYDRTTA